MLLATPGHMRLAHPLHFSLKVLLLLSAVISLGEAQGLESKLFKPVVFKGEPVTLKDASRASLFTPRILSVDSQGRVVDICTGVLVAEDVVMTAAHCLSAQAQHYRVSFQAEPGTLPFETLGEGVAVHPQYSLVAPGFKASPRPSSTKGSEELLTVDWAYREHLRQDYLSAKSGGLVSYKVNEYNSIPQNDIALVFLKEKAPAPFRPVKFATQYEPHYLQGLKAFGYGLYGLKAHEFDSTLRSTEVHLVAVIVDERFITGLMAFGFGDSNVCLGDSGGPLLVEVGGEYHLIGILSAQDNACHGHSFFVVPHLHADWLSKELSKHLARKR